MRVAREKKQVTCLKDLLDHFLVLRGTAITSETIEIKPNDIFTIE